MAVGSAPGQGTTNIPHATKCSQKKKKMIIDSTEDTRNDGARWNINMGTDEEEKNTR